MPKPMRIFAPMSDGGTTTPPVTVVILTLNEATQIESCISSIPSRFHIVIVDSGSTDGTQELAGALGARVIERPWAGFAAQRNFALRECVETEWTLFIDADERFPDIFFDWMTQTALLESDVDVYQIPSTLILNGRPLMYAPGYPILHPRLVRRGTVFTVNHAGHGETAEPCRSARAPIGYSHYFHSGDLTPWLAKHVRLAQFEAGSRQTPTTARARLASRVPRGPLRAILRFAFHYILRGGIRDGKEGLEYSIMYAWYELTIYLIEASRRVR